MGLPSSTPSIPKLGELGWHFRIWLHPCIPPESISHRNHVVLVWHTHHNVTFIELSSLHFLHVQNTC